MEVLSEDSRIPKSDVGIVFEAVYNNHAVGLDVFLTFMYNNINAVEDKYGKNLRLVNLFTKLGNKLIGKEQLSKVSLSSYLR